MYLTQVRLENIKCFADITLDFKASRDDEATRQQNWNVILGDNAAGKTTLLQAIAACLMPTYLSEKLLTAKSIRYSHNCSRYTLHLQSEKNDLPHETLPQEYAIQLGRVTIGDGKAEVFMPPHGTQPKIIDGQHGVAIPPPGWKDEFDEDLLKQYELLQQTAIFTAKKGMGWISCGYGALRRSRGSTTNGVNIEDNSIQERFITLFVEEAALYKGENWLKDLERFALKAGSHSLEQKNFDTIKRTIIEVLPEVEDLILDDRLRFVQKGQKYTLDELSDGYRAMFVLAIDILRWLDLMNADTTIPLNHAAGVVLIDEIDAHLHPKWQRKIGFELTRIFPNIQFIVTTHSPYIAMAAGEGALTVLEKGDDAVIANQNIPLVRDWTVDRILNDLFHESEYSVVVEEDLKEYDKLQAKKQRGEMTENELQDLIKLTDDLNQRLADDENSPKQQTLEKYLAELDNLLETEAE